MNIVDYQKSMQRTIPSKEDDVEVIHRLKRTFPIGTKEKGLVVAREHRMVLVMGMHGLLGLMDEAGEIEDAILRMDKENLEEEIGDAFWYVGLLCISLNTTIQERQHQPMRFTVLQDNVDAGAYMTKYIGEVACSFKSTLFYGKAKGDALLALTGIIQVLVWYALHYDLDLGAILQANQDKLKARYPEKFTTQDAIERKDKKDGE